MTDMENFSEYFLHYIQGVKYNTFPTIDHFTAFVKLLILENYYTAKKSKLENNFMRTPFSVYVIQPFHCILTTLCNANENSFHALVRTDVLPHFPEVSGIASKLCHCSDMNLSSSIKSARHVHVVYMYFYTIPLGKKVFYSLHGWWPYILRYLPKWQK